MLASTACAEARVAGMNLYGIQVVKIFSGTIAFTQQLLAIGVLELPELQKKEQMMKMF